MPEITVKTSRRVEAIDITREVSELFREKDGSLLHLYTPHTTCGLLINENADPAVMQDIIGALDRLVPREYPYRHFEGNSDAHVKSSLTGCQITVPFSGGMMRLGRWQGVFLMEFDGPRQRKVIVTLL